MWTPSPVIRTAVAVPRPGRRASTIRGMRRLPPLLGLLLIVSVTAVTGCSELGDRLDDSVNRMATKALEDGVRKQLADAGVQLQSGPDCSTDLSREGVSLAGTASCSGVTVDGLDATATFDGNLSSSGCDGTVTVVVDGRTVVEAAEVPDCSVNL
jgi:hypothetical protein